MNLFPFTILSAFGFNEDFDAKEVVADQFENKGQHHNEQTSEDVQEDLDSNQIDEQTSNSPSWGICTKEQREKLSLCLEEVHYSLYNAIANIVEQAKQDELIFSNTKPVHNGPDFKSFTPYRKLGKNTPNYKLCLEVVSNKDENDNTGVDENGLLVYEGYYLVAIGRGWSDNLKVGDKFMVYIKNEETGYTRKFPVMICDEKANKDTDSTHKYTVENGCIVEFYVDYKTLNPNIKWHGTISVLPEFSGKVLTIIPIEGEK